MIKKGILFFIFVFFSGLYSESPCLKDFLLNANKGDFIVAETMKMLTLIRVRESDNKTVILEEITAPSKKRPSEPWDSWLKKRAPGHSSWSVLEISVESGKILDCYSFSRNTYIQLSQKESLLASLLLSPLKEVPENLRKKVGPPPLEGERDVRKSWSPPFIYEGKKVAGATFDVFQTSWPDDGSELGGRDVTFYFDKEKNVLLPIWIEIETSHITGKIRVLDSGKNLSSPLQKVPKKRALDLSKLKS